MEKQNLHYSAQDLSEQDLEWIATLYGISNIEEIYDVTGMQEMMIKNQSQVKNSYVLQLMIRTKLKLEPISFREQIDKICKKLDNLRSNYVYIKTEHPYRVVLKNRTADVSFVDLSEELKNETEMKIHDMLENLMEADRLTGFDLERSSLLRVLIYKLDKEDTYAFLISQPHVNSDGISVMMLFRDLFIAYGLKQISGVELPVMESSFREYAEYLKSVDRDKEIAYWKEYLADVGEPLALPGYTPSQLDYELNLFTQAFNEETVKKLHSLQKSTGATFATIIQATWAVLLARLTNSKNVVFGSVTSGRDSEVANSMRISGGFINTLLLNCKTESDRQFADLVDTNFNIRTGLSERQLSEIKPFPESKSSEWMSMTTCPMIWHCISGKMKMAAMAVILPIIPERIRGRRFSSLANVYPVISTPLPTVRGS